MGSCAGDYRRIMVPAFISHGRKKGMVLACQVLDFMGCHLSVTCSALSICPQDRQGAALSRPILTPRCSPVVRIVSNDSFSTWMDRQASGVGNRQMSG